jgi:hypothetical protein
LAYCSHSGHCFFYNEQENDMPHTTEYLRDMYCNGRFTECALFRISSVYGKDKVPKYLYPNDMFETLHFDVPETHNSQGELAMMIKVLYADGHFGTVRSAQLGELVKKGGIAAYNCSEGWVEVRRMWNIGYSGPERRVHSPGMSNKGISM